MTRILKLAIHNKTLKMNHLLTFTGILVLFLSYFTVIVTSNDLRTQNPPTVSKISNISITFSSPAIYDYKFPMSFPSHKITSRILSFDDSKDDLAYKNFRDTAKVSEFQTGTMTSMKNELERPNLTKRNHGHVPTHIKTSSSTNNHHNHHKHSSESFNTRKSSSFLLHNNNDEMVERGSENNTKFVTKRSSSSINNERNATTRSLSLLDTKRNKDALSTNIKSLVQDDFNYKDELLMVREHDKPEAQQMVYMCRQQTLLPSHLFRLHACAFCYYYTREKKWKLTITSVREPNENKIISNYDMAQLFSPETNLTIFANASDQNSPLLPSFSNDHAKENWIDCCHAAESCCGKMKYESSQQNETDKGKTCPATWDGWQCWNKTLAGTRTHAPCPVYIYAHLSEAPSCAGSAEKTCLADGKWFRKSNNVEWTNYTSCAADVIEAQKLRTYVHVSAYSVTIIAVIPALIIFFSYKQLRVHRIILHQNLFFSMLLNGIFVIAFKTIVILNQLNTPEDEVSIISENGIGCRFLFILTKYSRMTNYMWMFCEGYYLHKLIASAFAEQKSLIIFYIIGWVFPIIPTIVYGSLRIGYANELCWVLPQERFEWILNGPSLLSLLINMLFLINIIRVLVTKLRAAHANEPSQYRKAVRATLVLLPLFGLHFVVTIYRPKSFTSGACEWLEIYFYTNDILDGIQGFLVALIFCYLNGEVVYLLKRTYGRWNEQHGMSGGCPRGRSSTRNRQQSRSSRGGSFLGRSVVSTQCYSSVPPSPEICCNLVNRLSLSSSNHTSTGGGEATTNATNKRHSSTPSPKLSPINGNGLAVVATVVKMKNSDRNDRAEAYELKPSTTNHQNTSLQIINVEDMDGGGGGGAKTNNFSLSSKSKSKKNNEHQL